MKIHKFLLGSFLISVAITVLLVAILAFFTKILALNNTLICAVNQVIKVIALFVGLRLFLKRKGILYGVIYGAAYSLVTGLIFMAIAKTAPSFVSFLLDGFYCLIVGGILGAIIVNLKNAR